MPIFGNGALGGGNPPYFAANVAAGPRLIFALLVALLVANMTRAKFQTLSTVHSNSGVGRSSKVDRVMSEYAQNRTAHAPPPESTYPLNLKRDYDGSWSVAVNDTFPFGEAPDPEFAKQDLLFENPDGFASLNAENHPREKLGSDMHYVDGEIILRDGAYRTFRDVLIKVIGVYKVHEGIIMLVGDFLYEDNALHRLYELVSEQKGSWKLSEEAFADALAADLERQRDHYLGRGSKLGSHPVQSKCDFEAVFYIAPGHFSGTTPSPRELASHEGNNSEYIKMNGNITSKQCGTSAEIELATFDRETLFVKAINYTLLVTFVAFTQVLVLIRQMEMTSTPAGANRVSLLSVGLQTVSDSYLFLAHLTMGMFAQRFSTLFNAFAIAAFFKFIIFSIFEMRYMLMIWKARRPSGFSGGWDAMRRELSILYSRFYGSLLFGLIMLYRLQKYMRVFVFALYSFWVPQIFLSIIEDHRRPLHPLYIVGMSATRLAIPLYFLCCPRNFLHVRPQYMTGNWLMAWVAFQASILLLQHRYGARCLIPKRFLPEKYDYYRMLTEPAPQVERLGDVESGNLDEVVPVPGNHYRGKKGSIGYTGPRLVDCVICMTSVSLNGPNRMATPCEHVFHEDCLQQWMDEKMECPTCRRLLPPP
ncbi:hypothetical protein NDN08_005221 [Rhodosorus marinus]|uniref:RING-type E3 ubiquitin transferase n=1 Tax=Rhodosorus marinus TaxID=101924 RepID=A0AAV8V457_9RHOD|nr:hypothetical protein NDN08_005221 [Rhodosorus marinus]